MFEARLPIPIDSLRQEHVKVLIDTFEKAGYGFEVKPSHTDERDRLHFRKDMGIRPYPHFHLIYTLKDRQFEVHIDIRKHKADHTTSILSEELERLYHHFTKENNLSRSTSYGLMSSLAKQAITLALFNTADSVDYLRKNPIIRQQAIRKSDKLRKRNKYLYRRKRDAEKVEFGGFIEDWEPLGEEIKRYFKQNQ